MGPADAFRSEGQVDEPVPAVDPSGQRGILRIIGKDHLACFFRFPVDPQGIFQEALFIDPGGKIKPYPGSVLGYSCPAGPVPGGLPGVKTVGPVKNSKGVFRFKIKAGARMLRLLK